MVVHGHRRRRSAQGLGALVLALFQLAVVGFVPIADAALERRGAGDPIHVESQDSEDCHARHDHVFCQLCRALAVAGGIAAGPATATPPVVCAGMVGALAGLTVPSSTPRSGGVGPRAPPLA